MKRKRFVKVTALYGNDVGYAENEIPNAPFARQNEIIGRTVREAMFHLDCPGTENPESPVKVSKIKFMLRLSV